MNLLVSEPAIPYLCECGGKYFAKRTKNCFGIFGYSGWTVYFCIENIVKFTITANMATKIQQILESNPNSSLFFGDWLTKQGLNPKEQHSYMKRGWLTRISKGVYALKGKSPTLLQTVAAYNSQLDKQCIVGAYTALELRGY